MPRCSIYLKFFASDFKRVWQSNDHLFKPHSVAVVKEPPTRQLLSKKPNDAALQIKFCTKLGAKSVKMLKVEASWPAG